MRCLSVCVALLLVQSSYAQRDKFALSFCPLAAADYVSFPTIQAGFEYKLTPRIAWYNEFGVEYAKGGYDRDTTIVHPHGIKAKTELRWYFEEHSGRKWKYETKHYLAANVFFTHDLHNTSFTYLQNRDTGRSKVDVIGVRKSVLGLNIVYGAQEPLSKRWSLDAYLGLGVRFRWITNSHMEYNSKTDYLPKPIDVPNIGAMRIDGDTRGGYFALPNVSIGVRIVYRL